MKRATLLACLFFVCATGLAGTVFAQNQQTAPPRSRYINGVPFFMVIPRGDSQRALAEAFASANIPMWSGSFTISDAGVASSTSTGRRQQGSRIFLNVECLVNFRMQNYALEPPTEFSEIGFWGKGLKNP